MIESNGDYYEKVEFFMEIKEINGKGNIWVEDRVEGRFGFCLGEIVFKRNEK